jgi:hypothetical protein
MSANRTRSVWLIVTAALVALTYLPQISAPLELQDDHRIVESAMTPHRSGITGALSLWGQALYVDVIEVGRFRPVGQIFDVIGPLVLGTNPVVWHVLLLAIAVSAAVTFFILGRTLFGTDAAGVVLALVILLAPDPGPTAAWYRLGPKEAWSTLLLGLTLLVLVSGRMARGRETLFVVLAVICSLSKESFVLLLPALIGVRVVFQSRAANVGLPDALRRVRWTALTLALVFVAEVLAILYVVRSAGARSYGGESLSMSASSIAQVVARDLVRAPMLSIWFVPVLLALMAVWMRGGGVRHILVPAALILAWVVPQYVLYATRGGFWDHYWLPCVVAFAAMNAAAVAALSIGVHRVSFGLAVCAIVLWTLNAMRIDFYAVRNFAVRASVQQETVRLAAAHVAPGSTLVVVGGRSAQGERAAAFASFVQFAGGRHAATLRRLPEELPATPLNDVSVIAYVDPVANVTPPGFVRRCVTRSQEFLSLRGLRRTDVPFTLCVDLREKRGSE